METTTSRSERLFPAREFNPTPIYILGLGAGGSQAAMVLGKLGVTNLIGCDTQFVEPPNVGTSIYRLASVGMLKTTACQLIVEESCGTRMRVHDCRAQELGPLEGVVFVCVDDMDVRQEIILQQCVPRTREAQRVMRVIEGRMSAETLTVHSFDPGDEGHVSEWLRYWFPQSEALPALAGCGAESVSANYTAGITARIMGALFVEWFAFEQGRAPRAHNQVRYDLTTFEGQGYFW
jgi:hypothetical protein